MEIIESLEEANKVLTSDERVLVCFMARWCPPCRMINLSFERFEEEHSDARIFKIDVNQFKDLAFSLNATGVPVTFVVENGTIVSTHNGFMDSDEITRIYYNKE